MRAAATKIRLHVGADLVFIGLGDAIEQRLGAHDHACDAVATLGGLLGGEGLLQAPRRGRTAQSFDRAHLAPQQGADRREAGEHGLAIDDHGAGAALAQPAAELGAVQLKIVAKGVEQRRRGIDVEPVVLAVDREDDAHEASLRARPASAATLGQGDRSLNRSRR